MFLCPVFAMQFVLLRQVCSRLHVWTILDFCCAICFSSRHFEAPVSIRKHEPQQQTAMAQLALAAMATGSVDCADEEIPLEPIADQNFNRRKVLDLQHELTRLQMLGTNSVKKAPLFLSCLCHPLISFVPFRHCQEDIEWESLKDCAQSEKDTLNYT